MTAWQRSGRLRRAAVAFAAAFCAAGCSSLAPDFNRPSPPVPEAYPPLPPGRASPAGRQDARADGDTGWREFFTDSRLLALIDLALANNRDLRIAALNIEQTRALTRCAAPTSCRPSTSASAAPASRCPAAARPRSTPPA